MDRPKLKDELLDELFANAPGKALLFMRRWPGGD